MNFASPQLRFLDPIFMRQLSRRCRHRYTAVATLTARWGYGTRSRAVAMSKSRPDVSKMTHGFFITINSMILYFKHILHIDDFPLNGHPPSYKILGSISFKYFYFTCHVFIFRSLVLLDRQHSFFLSFFVIIIMSKSTSQSWDEFSCDMVSMPVYCILSEV